jgi:hypothetical protein
MKQISNNSLVAFLAIALVVSVSASLYSFTEVSDMGAGFDMLTSAAVADVGVDNTGVGEEPVVVEEESVVEDLPGDLPEEEALEELEEELVVLE